MSEPRKLRGREISGGSARGEVLLSPDPLSFYGGFDLSRGVVTERGHPLEGRSVAGRVLVFPTGKGSTVGSYALLRLAKGGVAPAALVMASCDTTVAVGAIIAEIPCVDQIDIASLAPGDRVRVEGAEILVEPDERQGRSPPHAPRERAAERAAAEPPGAGRGGVVVKLGGSIVTDKGATDLRVRGELVARLARELAEAAPRPLVVIHGAGSFGHHIVHRTELHRGVTRGSRSLLDWGETQRLQYVLDSQIARILLDAGLPVMPVQASASAVMRGRRLVAMDVEALRLMVDQGLIPLLYGVPAVDRDQGCSILSGDQIAPYVAGALGIERLIHATDVDGVFEADPKKVPEARRFDRIDRSNWGEVRARLGGSGAVDVTGGMAGKVEALIELSRRGLSVRIVDATAPGRLAAALANEPVGTLVLSGEEET